MHMAQQATTQLWYMAYSYGYFPKMVQSAEMTTFISKNCSPRPSLVLNYDFKMGRLDNEFLGNGHMCSTHVKLLVSNKVRVHAGATKFVKKSA